MLRVLDGRRGSLLCSRADRTKLDTSCLCVRVCEYGGWKRGSSVGARDQRYYYPVVLSLIVSFSELFFAMWWAVSRSPTLSSYSFLFLLALGWGVLIWAQKLEKFV